MNIRRRVRTWAIVKARFILWRRVTTMRAATWLAAKGRHGRNLPGRVKLLAVCQEGCHRWIVSVPHNDLNEVWNDLEKRGVRCSVLRVIPPSTVRR